MHMGEYSPKPSNSTGILTADFFDNPYPTYRKLRETEPVHWSEESSSWLVTSYKDVRDHLRNPGLSAKRDKRQITQLPPDQRQEIEPLREFYSNWIMYLDPPEHTRLRRAVNRVFTPPAVEKRRGDIEQITQDLLSHLGSKTNFDLLHDFASPLAVAVVANTVGIDPVDYQQIKTWSDDIDDFIVRKTRGYKGALAAQKSFEGFSQEVEATLSKGRVFPQATVLDSLVVAQEEGVISKKEAVAIYGNVLLDGHEPIANGIANGVFSLLINPQQKDLLWGDPNLVPRAMEELLRFESPFPLSARVANQDVEIGDKKISAGEKVLLLLGAANRDPDQFTNPDNLDITYDPRRHLAFGSGAHHCLGAALARPTLSIAYSALIENFPSLRLDGEAEWQPLLGVRELRHLPVKANKLALLG